MKRCKIEIFLSEGDPNGIRSAQISMSTIHAIAFRRNQLGKIRDTFPEIAQTGVYILIGQDEERAYIGESDTIINRLNRHNTNEKENSKKEFWTDTIVLVSKDENLTKSHVRYVENQLIAEAEKNPRWNLDNSQRASEAGKLPLADRVSMDEFIDQTVTLVGALGCDLFRAMRVSSSTEEIGKLSESQSILSNRIFSYKGKDGSYDAKMLVNNSGEFIVQRGSRARIKTTNTIPTNTISLRKKLIEKNILKEEDGSLIFTSDYIFPSISSAAATVYGGSANGRTAWRLPNKQTYADWEVDMAIQPMTFTQHG